jgi:phosphatidylserine decarboxylase
MTAHQYIERYRNKPADEILLADQVIAFLYSRRREEPGFLLNALGSGIVTDALAHWQFDRHLAYPKHTIAQTAHRLMIGESETVSGFAHMKTLRELFERQIRYWDVRPLPDSPSTIVSPADGKLLPFAAFDRDALPIKSKFVRIDELLGGVNPWQHAHDSASRRRSYCEATIAPLAGVVVRLTPDVYHYTHAPVSGRVLRYQTIEGRFHSCNPTALTRFPGSYAFNRRAITVYDTDVADGSNVGIVVQVDVAAMMIGQIESRYTPYRYVDMRPLSVGDFVQRGAPVSLFRPGSSTSIVIWDGHRAAVSRELLANAQRCDLRSRFSDWLGQPWVETRVAVRQSISEPGVEI